MKFRVIHQLPFLLVLLSLAGSIGFARYYLAQGSRKFTDEFRAQNFSELSRGDSYALTQKLNALSSSIPWTCIIAQRNGIVFFEKVRGKCDSGPVTELTLIDASNTGGITVAFTTTLPTEILLACAIFSVLQIALLLLLGASIKATQQIKQEKVLQKERAEKETQTALSLLATQVAHDIRSPLAALDNVICNINALPEDDRILVRTAVNRIKDIANNLIQKNREASVTLKELQHSLRLNTPNTFSTTEASIIQLCSSLIDPLITEKRMQFRSKIGIEIDGRLDALSYGLFAKVQPTEFKRMISNLVNNAVEALGEKGTVTITLAGEHGTIEIRVIDNGKGISPEILSTLGQRGETHGKPGGSGLGLYHARYNIESWGGTLTIESELGKGTAVIIRLPQTTPPAWFVSALELVPGTAVVVLDDDTSIHGIWESRFDSLGVKEQEIEVFHFSTPNEFTKWVKESQAARTALYLMDQELLDHNQTGLTLIEGLGLAKQAILVTSRFEERHIREKCASMMVRLIPKGMAGFVPIEFQKPLEKMDAVLLDDDDLVQLSWRNVARQNKKALRSFTEPAPFFAALHALDRSTPIFIDSNLKNGIKGQELVPKVRELGFRMIYLTTGYDQSIFTGISGLTGIVGKDPPVFIGGVVNEYNKS